MDENTSEKRPCSPHYRATFPVISVADVIMSKRSGKRKQTVRFTLDCSIPVGDDVLDTQAFKKFLADRIKVDKKRNNLTAGGVELTADEQYVNVEAKAPFSKRQLKYLAKKYLKKVDLRDFLRVVASDKNTYQLRYFNLTEADEDDEEEDADE